MLTMRGEPSQIVGMIVLVLPSKVLRAGCLLHSPAGSRPSFRRGGCVSADGRGGSRLIQLAGSGSTEARVGIPRFCLHVPVNRV